MEFSDCRFPIKIEFGCEPGCFLLYLSFSHQRPSREHKDMMTRSSKFELLHPPNQKTETELLMRKKQKPRMKDSKTIDFGKFVYFSVYPFKNMQVSVMISCQMLTNIERSETLGYDYYDDESVSDVRLHVSSKRDLEEEGGYGEKDDFVKKNKVVAKIAGKVGEVNQRLFQMIHEKRMKAVQEKKQQIAQATHSHRISAISENRSKARLIRTTGIIETVNRLWSIEVDRCRVKFWLTMIHFRRVFMDVRNIRLNKDKKVSSNFDELFQKIRFRKIGSELSGKLKAEEMERLESGRPTLTEQISRHVLRTTAAMLADQTVGAKVRAAAGLVFSQINEIETRLNCFNGVTFQLKWRQFREYKRDRIEWYQIQWNKHQAMLVKLSKDQKCSFHNQIEEDLKSYTDRFYNFQVDVLSALYNIEYYRYIERLTRKRKENDPNDPYSVDLPRLSRWVETVGFAPVVRRAEDLLKSFTGFDKLFDKISHQFKQREKLGYAGEHKEDQAFIEKLEREGLLGKLAKATHRLQDVFLKNKFVFKVDPAYMINIIVCAYHLEEDPELMKLLEKRDPTAAKTRKTSMISSLSK